jgi:hypothetical protein
MPNPAARSTTTAAPITAPERVPHILTDRQESFARHIAAGCGVAEAARRAGYDWNSARHIGNRLIGDWRIAARAADIAEAEEARRQAEADELVGVLKKVMYDALEKGNHFAVLRAIDQIARFRKLTPSARSRKTPLAAREAEEDNGADVHRSDDHHSDSRLADDDPTQPPLDPEAPSVQIADPRDAGMKALTDRIVRCYDSLLETHPDLARDIRAVADARHFFDDDCRLLPRDKWPERWRGHGTKAAASSPSSPPPPLLSPVAATVTLDTIGIAASSPPTTAKAW